MEGQEKRKKATYFSQKKSAAVAALTEKKGLTRLF